MAMALPMPSRVDQINIPDYFRCEIILMGTRVPITLLLVLFIQIGKLQAHIPKIGT